MNERILRRAGVPSRRAGVPSRRAGVPSRCAGVPSRCAGVPSRCVVVAIAAVAALFAVWFAAPAAAQTLEIEPRPRMSESSSTARTTEGGWVGLEVTPSGDTPTGDVTLTCRATLRGGTSDVRNLQKSELRASATATEPLGASDPLPTVTLTFNAANWGAPQFCAFWTYDDLMQRGTNVGAEAGQRWFRVGAQQSDINGDATIAHHPGQDGTGTYRAVVNQNDATPTGPNTLRFFAVGASVAEGRSAWFDMVLSQPIASGLSIPYTITPAASGGAGITAADFTADATGNQLTGTFTIAANNLRNNDRQRIEIADPGGGTSESAETFTVTLGLPTIGGGNLAPSLIFLQTSADKTILADDATDPAAATISLAASATDVDEGDSVDLTFTLSQAYSGEIRFRYGITGIDNDDIIGDAGNHFGIVPANQLSLTVPIHVLVDGSAEAAETMTVEIHMAGSNLDGTTRWPSRANPPLARHSSAHTVSIDIAASTDTTATAAAVATSVTVAEAGSGSGSAVPNGQAMFTVSLTGLRLQPSTVEYTITASQTNGASVGVFDATSGAAFPLTRRLTIPPGTNPSAALNIPILVPGAGDSLGGFVVTLTSIQFAEASTATTLSGKTISGTAGGGARVWIARVTPATGDVSESTNPVYSLNYDGPAIADGAPVTVAWEVSAPAGDDPDGDGPATAADGRDFNTSDFSFPDGSHTFAAGMGGSGAISSQFTVELRDDITEEGPEFFTVTIRVTAPSDFDGYLSTSSITAVIAANDTPIPMTVSFVESAAPTVPVTSFSVAESSDSDLTATPSTNHFICVGITELPEGVTDLGATQVVVQLTATAGSAGVGEFSIATNQDPHLGEFRTGCTTLTVTNDLIPEDAETLTLSMRMDATFSRLAGAVTFGPDATVVITDSDPIVIELDAESYSVREGESVSVTAVMTTPPSTVPIEIADWSAVARIATSVESGDTAVESTDFTAASREFTFTNARRRHALRITTVETFHSGLGGHLEESETFTVTLSEPTAIDRVTAADTASVTITDDDNLAWVRRAVGVSEGATDIQWELGTTNDYAEGTVITYQLETDLGFFNVPATPPEQRATAADLTPPTAAAGGSGAFPILLSYTVASGDTTSSGVTISTGYGVEDDNLNEGVELLRLRILSISATGAFPHNQEGSETITIAADSGDATVIDSITLETTATPREGDDVFFTVQLTGGVTTADVSVLWTRTGDAEAEDFAAASAVSPLTIPAGQMWGQIKLVLAADADTSDSTATDAFAIALSATADGNTDGGGDGVTLTATTADRSASVTSISAAASGAANTDFFVLTGDTIAEPSTSPLNDGTTVLTDRFHLHYYSSAGDGTRLSADTTVSVSIVPAGGARNPIEHNSANGQRVIPGGLGTTTMLPSTIGDIWKYRPGSHAMTPRVPPTAEFPASSGFPTAAQLRGPTVIRDFQNMGVTFRAFEEIDSCGSLTSRSGCRPTSAERAELASFALGAEADDLNEGPEYFWIYLTASRGRVGAPLLVTLTDNADDALSVSIAPSPDADGNTVASGTAFAEGALARFTVSISGATATQDVVVDYAISGANIEPGDFIGGEATALTALTGHSVTVPLGRTSAEIVLRLAEDQVLELAEAFTVTLSNPRTAGAISVGTAAASLGIAADPAGEAALTLTPHVDRSDVGNTEVANVFRVQLHRADDTGTAMTFGQNVRIAATHGGSACQGTIGNNCGASSEIIPDYTYRTAGGVTWADSYVQLAAGSSNYNLSVTIRGDQYNEGDETITITLTGVTGLPAAGGAYAAMDGVALPTGGLSTTFTIANDDALTVRLVPQANAAEVPEGGMTSLRIELRGGGPHSGTPMTIRWAVRPTTATSDNDADPADFTASNGGSTGLTALPSGSFSNAVLGRLDGAYNGVSTAGNSPSRHNIPLYITDEDLPDGNENFDVVVTISNAGSDDVSFDAPHADGRAHYGIDAGRDQQLAFTLSGPTVGGAAATSVPEDEAAAADRTVTYTVTYTTHAMALGVDDMPGTASLTGAATLTLTLSADTDPATRDAQFGAPGATNDFVDAAAQTVTFAGGDAPGSTRTATFVINNDNRSEKAETFLVTLGGLAEDEGIDNAYIDEENDAHIASAEIAASDAVTWTLESLSGAAVAEPTGGMASHYFRLTPSPSLDSTVTGHALLGNDNLERISLALSVQTPTGAATQFVDADGDTTHDVTGETPDYSIETLVFSEAEGNAISAADLATGVGNPTVSGCENAVCIRVRIFQDDLNEGAETINLRLDSLSALQSNVQFNTAPAHASRNAVITIGSNDPLSIAIGDAAAAVHEGSALAFPLTISGGAPASGLTLAFTVAGAGITASDFTTTIAGDPLAGSVVLSVADATAASPTLDLFTSRDATMEGAETVTVTLTSVTSGGGGGSVALAGADANAAERMATGTINANSALVRRLVAVSDAAMGVTEAASTTFMVTMSAMNSGDANFGFSAQTTVNWEIVYQGPDGESLAEAADFNAADRSGSVMFDAGATAAIAVTVRTAGDFLNEADEYFRVRLSLADSNADGGSEIADPVEIYILDDDPITVALSAPLGPLTEADNLEATFEVSLSGGLRTGAVIVPLTFSGLEDADFNIGTPTGVAASATGLTLTFPAADPTAVPPVRPGRTDRLEVVLAITNNTVNSADKTIVLTGTPVGPTGLRSVGAVNYPPTNAEDPMAPRENTVQVRLRDDDTLTFTVTPANGASVSEGSTHTITLAPAGATMLDAAVTVGWSASVAQSTDADAGTNTATRPDLQFIGTATPAGTAAATTLSGRQVVFPADTALASMQIQIGVNADIFKEGAETATVAFTATAANGGGMVTAPADHTFNIPANEAAARSVTVAGPGVVGEDADIEFTVTIDGEPVTEQFSIAWTLGTDSDSNTDDATLSGANRDITSATTGTLPVPVSTARMQTLTISLLVLDDTVTEDDEVLTLTLTDPCAGMTAAQCGVGGRPDAFAMVPGVSVSATPAVATIGQSDQAVTLQIAAPGTALEEALRTVQAAASGAFTVSFAESVVTTMPIQVQWRLKFPTAVAGPDATRIVPAVLADFASATRSGTATIPAGMSSADFTVTTAADLIQEPVETFIVELHGTPMGGGAIAGSGLAISTTAGEDTATIARSDDGGGSGVMSVDMVPTASTQAVDEGAAATFTVRLFHASGQPGQPVDLRTTGPSPAMGTSSVAICVSYTVAITMQRNPSMDANTAENHDIGGVTDCDGVAVSPVVAADGATLATGGVRIPVGRGQQSFTVNARFDNIDETATAEEMVVTLSAAEVPTNSGVTAPGLGANTHIRRTANIANINAARALSISGPASAVDEGDMLEFTVSVTGRAIQTPFNVEWRVTAGEGEIDTAATPASDTLRFADIGDMTISLATRDDALSEPADTVTITLTDPCPDSGVCGIGGRAGIANAATPALQLTGNAASGTVRESDRPVTVTIAAPAGDLAEGTASNFTVSFPESVTTTAAVTVAYSISFPAASTTVNPAVAADFSALTSSVDIPAGMATVNLPITALDDAIFEADEDFTVTLTSVSGGGAIAAPVLAAAARANAKIDASDPVTVGIARATGQAATVVEGGTARFTVSLALTADTTMTATAAAPICVMFGTAVNQQMTANTAAQGADITVTDCAGAPVTVVAGSGGASGGARIPAGASSAIFGIGARYDNYDEGMTAETLAVTLSSAADTDANFTYPTVSTAASPGNVASVGITNTNAARSVTVSAPADAVPEDAGTFNFTVTITGEAVTQGFQIPWTITAGSATVSGGGADISSATSGMLRVPTASARMQTLTIAVTVTDDSAAENDETLMLALTDICSGRAATACSFGGRPAGFDTAPTVVVSTTAATATIGQSDQTVTLQIAAPGGDLTEGTAADFTVSFSESVTTTSGITFSWVNNPGVTASADTAQSADFGQASLTGSATIPAGMNSVTVPITAADDTVNEGAETFTVRISSPSGGGAIVGSGLTVSSSAGAAQASIAASDPVQISLARRSGQSGAVVEGSNAEFTVSLALVSAASTAATAAGPICVTFRTEVTQQNPSGMANTAANADVEVRNCAGMPVTVAANGLATNGGVLIPAGQSSATLRVLARYDDIDEGATDEELAVQIRSAAFQPALSGATAPVIDTNQETVRVDIQNTNALRTIAAATPTATVNEGHAAYLFQITLAGSAPVRAFTVQWAVTGPDNNPDDSREFTGGPSGSVTFGAGDTAAKQVTVRARDDAYNEGPETLTLTVTNPCPASGTCEIGGRNPGDPQAAPALALSNATSTVTIAASDPIALSIAQEPPNVLAGQSAEYTLHFGCANAETGPGCTEVIPTTVLMIPLTVTIGGTAETVPDRTVPLGTRTFTLTAAEINMNGENHGQTLSVTPSAPTQASLPPGATATATGSASTEILGWTVALTADRISAPEGSTFDFIITLNGAASELNGGGITVPWAIAGTGENATRVDDADFEGERMGSVAFTMAGPMTQTVSVVTARNDDNNPDSDTEMFTFTIGALQGGSPLTDDGGDAGLADIVGEDAITATIGPPVDEDVAALNRVIMPEVARALAGAQMEAVSGRMRNGFDAGAGGDAAGIARAPLAQLGGQSTLSGMAAENLEALADDSLDWKQLASNSAFSMPLSAGGDGAGLAAGTFWGGGALRGVGGKSGSTDWSGDLFSAHLGFDARLNRDLLSGLLLSFSEVDIDDYTRVDNTRSARPTVSGEWLLEMTNFSPYLGWRADNGLEGWALASYGSGDLTIEERGGKRQSDVTQHTFGVGMSGALSRVAGRELRLSAEAFSTTADIGDSKTVSGDELGMIPGDELSANRVRVLLDLRRSRELASGANLESSGEFGARYDSGDGRTGGGLEVGGGVRYRDTVTGLTLEGRTRGLLAHSADYEDWGVEGSVKLESGADGQGLSLALSPGYGNSGSGARGMWERGVLAAADGDGDGDDGVLDLQAHLALRAGYGVRAFTDTGVLTPYSGMSFAGDSRAMQLGVEWDSGAQLRLKLSGERLDTDNADTTHGILFKGEMQF